MMLIELLVPLLILSLAFFIVRQIFSRGKDQGLRGSEIRHFFQFGLLFALTVISAIGVTGLLGRLLHIGSSLSLDRGKLALESTFTLIGIPLLLVIATWVRKSFRKDPNEASSLSWNLYLTATSIVALVITINAQLTIYEVIVGDRLLRGQDISQFFVWGAVWFFLFRAHKRIERNENALGDHLIGSLIGLGFSFVGLITILESVIRLIFPVDSKALLLDSNNDLLSGLTTLAVGAPVWYIYWVRTAAKAIKENLWYAYVLLIGIGAGLLTTIIAAAFSIYSILVWFIGDTRSESALTHFNDAPASISAALIGLLLIWYHRGVLTSAQVEPRSEIRRIYEYVISGISLVAAAGGLTMILVSIIQSLTKSSQITGTGSINTLIAAFTLILVGAPVWWFMWRAIQKQVVINPLNEQSSPVRRIYLFILFGVAGVTSVVTLLAATYIAFSDLFKGQIGSQTIRSDRFNLSILAIALLVAIYHWQIYKHERHFEIHKSKEEKDSELVSVISQINLKPRSAKKYLEQLNKYAKMVRNEYGCEQFSVLVDANLKNSVFVLEVWCNKNEYEAHLRNAEFINWKHLSDQFVISIAEKQVSAR